LVWEVTEQIEGDGGSFRESGTTTGGGLRSLEKDTERGKKIDKTVENSQEGAIKGRDIRA